MPRKTIDYSDTLFYKLVCRDLSIKEIYVGHTTNFTKRKNRHKFVCNNGTDRRHNLKVYQFIRENGTWENWDMIEICRKSCIDKIEASAIERECIETLYARLNCNIPNRTKEEYKVAKKDEIKEMCSIYYKANKEHLNEKGKKWKEANKDKINNKNKVFCKENKVKYALYREEHKDKIREYNDINKEKLKEKAIIYKEKNKVRILELRKIYYEDNRDKINEKRRTKKLEEKLLKQQSLETNI